MGRGWRREQRETGPGAEQMNGKVFRLTNGILANILNKMTHILGTTIIAIRWIVMVYVGYHDENIGVPACRQEQ